jgi:integrase/recombinase XerC
MVPDWGAYRAYMRRRRYHPNTVRARMSAAVDWIAFAGPAWESATFDDVEDWMAGRDLSPGSTRNLLVSLRAFYRWTVRTGLVASDPCRLVESVRLPMRLPRPADDRAIHDLLEQGDVLLSAIVALMAGAGLRCVEVSRLDWCDVDLHAGRVRVVGKGDRERILDVSDAVRMRLAALDHVVGAVFVGPSGDRMSPAAVSIYVNRRARQLALGVTAHQMRHRFATEALRQPGANLLAVRDALGHSSVATTQIYTALLPGLVAEMSRRVTLP